MAMDGLGARLLDPPRLLSTAELAAAWFSAVIVLRLPGGGRAMSAELTGKVRGALGAVLLETASEEAVAGRPCPWRPCCALDLLFRAQGQLTPGLALPKPWVLATDAAGDDLVLSTRLFGLASEAAEETAAGLVRAVRSRVAPLAGLEVAERLIAAEEGVAVPAAGRLALVFETPLRLRLKREPESLEAWLSSLVMSLANRVSGLARWHDARLDPDEPRRLKAALAHVRVMPLHDEPAHWRRYSQRQARWIPMAGSRPALLLEGDLGPLLPLLAMGARTHAGASAALGLGRYSLVTVDEQEQG